MTDQQLRALAMMLETIRLEIRALDPALVGDSRNRYRRQAADLARKTLEAIAPPTAPTA